MATLIDYDEPVLPITGNANIRRMANNHALGLGLMTAAAAAAESTRGALQYVPGAAGVSDQLLVTLKDSADAYVNRNFMDAALGRRPVIAGASNLTLGIEDSGSIIEVAATEAYVLPALTAANLGLCYEFVVTTTVSAVTITAGTADLLHGGVTIMSTGAGVENDAFSADGTDDLIFTMNGTTKGGIIGSTVRFIAASATKWIVTGNLIGSGTLVTPFS